MLEPSSSEEDEDFEESSWSTRVTDNNGSLKPPPVQNGGPRVGSPNDRPDAPKPPGGTKDRTGSPSPSLTSEKTLTEAERADKQQKDEEDRKQRIQLYVFVLRSISYPFNAKQPGDMTKRHLKVDKVGLDKLRSKVEVLQIFFPFQKKFYNV